MARLSVAAVALAALAFGLGVLLGGDGKSPSPVAEQASPSLPDLTPAEQVAPEPPALARWAYVERRVQARTRPTNDSPPIMQLSRRTEDRTPELVQVLPSRRYGGGDDWLRARLPTRPNNTIGWLPRSALGEIHLVTTALDVNRAGRTATLTDRGEVVWRARVAIGVLGSPTPRGRFYVRSRIVPTNAGDAYGPFAFGINGYSAGLTDWPGGGVVGLHGTDRPELIGRRVSHGCVRLRNDDIEELRELIGLGTPVRIH